MLLRPVHPATDVPSLDDLFDLVAECDGHRPIGEHKYLDLRAGDPRGQLGLVAESESGEILAYVALTESRQAGTWAMELVTHPLHRSRSEVAALLEAGMERVRGVGGEAVRVWTFHPHLAELLEHAGFTPERELRQLRVPLPVAEAPRLPSDVEVRPFRVGRDEGAWLQVNNLAFEGHPENGRWTEEILESRERQPWFEAEGFRMAWEGGDLVGSCWTKLHEGGMGEIYVVSVHPAHRGRGLGRALVLEGLRHLAEVGGARIGMLYVDADNGPALALYRGLGFRLNHVDRSYGRTLLSRNGDRS